MCHANRRIDLVRLAAQLSQYFDGVFQVGWFTDDHASECNDSISAHNNTSGMTAGDAESFPDRIPHGYLPGGQMRVSPFCDTGQDHLEIEAGSLQQPFTAWRPGSEDQGGHIEASEASGPGITKSAWHQRGFAQA